MGSRRLLSRIATFMAIIALILTNTSTARAEDFESPPPPGNFRDLPPIRSPRPVFDARLAAAGTAAAAAAPAPTGQAPTGEAQT